jgi:hypothetical protein
MANDGSFAVAYQSADLGESEFDVTLRLFDSQGEPVDAISLNTFTAQFQRKPSVAAMGSRGYVAAWESYGQDGDGYGIFARRFLGTAAADTTEFQVPASPDGWQDTVAIGANAEIIVTVWQMAGPLGDFELHATVLPVN